MAMEGHPKPFYAVFFPIKEEVEDELEDCEPGSSSANTCEDKEQVKEEITIAEHPIAATHDDATVTTTRRSSRCSKQRTPDADKSLLSRCTDRCEPIQPSSPLQCSTEFPTSQYNKIVAEKLPFSKLSQRNTSNDRMNIDASKRCYSCEVCHAKFSRKPHLTGHVRIHTGEKPFTCEVCQTKFSQKGHLTTHVRTHTGEKPFSCEICRAKFTQKSDLAKHIRTHTGEKPYSCDVCQAGFARKSQLTGHIGTHNDNRPLSCKVCQAKFVLKCHLVGHIRTHSGEHFSCDVCQAKFFQKCHLSAHIRRHFSEKHV